MPTYTFVHVKDETITRTEYMKISEMTKFLSENSEWKIKPAAPYYGDPVQQGRVKLDTPFRERLQEIKQKFPGSNMNIPP